MDTRRICPNCNGTGVIMDGYMGGWDCDYCDPNSKSVLVQYRRRTKAELEELKKSVSPLEADIIRINTR